MNNPSRRLHWRLFFICFGTILFVTFLLEMENVLVFDMGVSDLLSFNIPAVLTGDAVIVSLMYLLIHIRLREVRLFFKGQRTGEVRAEAFRKLLRLPADMFWSIMGISFLLSVIYHLISELYYGGYTEEPIHRLIHHYTTPMSGEFALALTTAALLFCLIRGTVRPLLFALGEDAAVAASAGSTFIGAMLITFNCGFLILVIHLIRYVMLRRWWQEPIIIGEILWISGFYALLAMAILLLLVRNYRQELREMIGGMQSLLTGDRSKLRGRMPVLSGDESGELASAFNEIQRLLSREYEELDRQMSLAFRVQQRLLPQSLRHFGKFSVEALCLPHKEVGGDLCDIVELPDRRFAALIGDVSGKGAPASLIMSAVMMLFRVESRRGGSAGELLDRLNRTLFGTLPDSMYVTAGIAIIDSETGTLEYASAGHLSPYILRTGAVLEVPCSSLPIGIDSEIRYNQHRYLMQTGDRLILYSDGVVERLDAEGRPGGFERFERDLGLLPSDCSLFDQLSHLLGISEDGGRCEDDRTAMLIRMNEAAV